MSLKGVTAQFYSTTKVSKAVEAEILDLIDVATDGSAVPNGETNRKIADMVLPILEPRPLSEIVRRMRKKLKSLRHATVMNALFLMELLMKVCHTDFHHAMANRKLMKQMTKSVKLAKGGDRARKEQAQKCLALIQTWGIAFKTKLAIGRAFVETYEAMRKKGWSFPEFGEHGAQGSGSPVAAPREQLSLSSEAERAELVDNTTMMLQTMVGSASTRGEVVGNEVVDQLVNQLNGFQREIATLVSGAGELELASLLALNEKVLEALEMHRAAIEEAGDGGGAPPVAHRASAHTASGSAALMLSGYATAASGSTRRAAASSVDSFADSVCSGASSDSADFVQPCKTVRFQGDDDEGEEGGLSSGGFAQSPASGAWGEARAPRLSFDDEFFGGGGGGSASSPDAMHGGPAVQEVNPFDSIKFSTPPVDWQLKAIAEAPPGPAFAGPVTPGWGQTAPAVFQNPAPTPSAQYAHGAPPSQHVHSTAHSSQAQHVAHAQAQALAHAQAQVQAQAQAQHEAIRRAQMTGSAWAGSAAGPVPGTQQSATDAVGWRSSQQDSVAHDHGLRAVQHSAGAPAGFAGLYQQGGYATQQPHANAAQSALVPPEGFGPPQPSFAGSGASSGQQPAPGKPNPFDEIVM